LEPHAGVCDGRRPQLRRHAHVDRAMILGISPPVARPTVPRYDRGEEIDDGRKDRKAGCRMEERAYT
jgi:hypothetical protein